MQGFGTKEQNSTAGASARRGKEREMAINRVMLVGNLTADAEVLFTRTGDPVLGFGLAFEDRRRIGDGGGWAKASNFVDCAVFGARGESLAPRLAKGAKVAVEGRLRYSAWEKDGRRRSKIELVVDEIEFMSAGKEAGGEDAAALVRELGGKPVEHFEEDRDF